MEENSIIIILWHNGKKKSNSFEYKINNIMNITLSHLKESIAKYIINKNLRKILEIEKDKFEIIHLYTNKEIDLEENDIPYLYNNEILFFTTDNSNFEESNFYYQYEFVNWIKSGGYGQVYLGKHVITQKEYAIKKIDTSSFSNQDLYNISREYVILKQLNHPNIIKCYQSFNYENTFYTVMDYAKGGELSSLLLEKKRLNEKQCKKIFQQIYKAVRYIHDQNIIHRDLKPNNILFLDENKTHIVLIDFGISGISNGKFKETVKAGTISFLPPEMVSGKDYTSNTKLDVWALGIILFRMIEGKFPFDGKKDKDIIQKILYSPLDFNKKIKISLKCKKLIQQMLEKNYCFRIDSDSELFQNWFEEEDFPIKSIQSMKTSQELFNDYVNDKRIAIMKTYENPNRNNIIQHISEFIRSDVSNLPKKRNSLKPNLKRNNAIFPRFQNLNSIENNDFDNSLEMSESNFKNNNNSKREIKVIRRSSLQNVSKFCIDSFPNRKINKFQSESVVNKGIKK